MQKHILLFTIIFSFYGCNVVSKKEESTASNTNSKNINPLSEAEQLIQKEPLPSIFWEKDQTKKMAQIQLYQKVREEDLNKLNEYKLVTKSFYKENLELIHFLLELESTRETTLRWLRKNKDKFELPDLDKALMALREVDSIQECDLLLKKYLQFLKVMVNEKNESLRPVYLLTRDTALSASRLLSKCKNKEDLSKRLTEEIQSIWHANLEMGEDAKSLIGEMKRGRYLDFLKEHHVYKNLTTIESTPIPLIKKTSDHYFSATGSYEVAGTGSFGINSRLDASEEANGRITTGLQTNGESRYQFKTIVKSNRVGDSSHDKLEIYTNTYVKGGYRRDRFGGEDQTARMNLNIESDILIPKCENIISCRPYVFISGNTNAYDFRDEKKIISLDGNPIQLQGGMVFVERLNQDHYIKLRLRQDDVISGACCSSEKKEFLEFSITAFVPMYEIDNAEPWSISDLTWLPSVHDGGRLSNEISSWAAFDLHHSLFNYAYFDSPIRFFANLKKENDSNFVHASTLHLERVSYEVNKIYSEGYRSELEKKFDRMSNLISAFNDLTNMVEETILLKAKRSSRLDKMLDRISRLTDSKSEISEVVTELSREDEDGQSLYLKLLSIKLKLKQEYFESESELALVKTVREQLTM